MNSDVEAPAATAAPQAPVDLEQLAQRLVGNAAVKEGDLLVILESMKMECYVYAPYNGTVAEVAVTGGQNVSAYQPLVRVARAEEEN